MLIFRYPINSHGLFSPKDGTLFCECTKEDYLSVMLGNLPRGSGTMCNGHMQVWKAVTSTTTSVSKLFMASIQGGNRMHITDDTHVNKQQKSTT
jgi:hypothetical protein